ncbi:alpha-ketoglutarate-dependent dioxygenase AlkB family protein [Robertkochia aurantiaca]|uniref:alpha-ketoglutarate-dependent dioxygenase AlkB family protein n=1 Tax=Robertkochia aurantiaca TaxID=2873700 RepID=UPI001CC9CBAB
MKINKNIPAERLPLQQSEIYYIPEFLSKKEADHYLGYFLHETEWRQDEITLFGKTMLQPRLTALYGNNEKTYTYSNIKMHPLPFPAGFEQLKDRIDLFCNEEFTTCLLNLYRHGNDSMGWHSDDEPELGLEPVIASLSLGAERIFHFRHKLYKEKKYRLQLGHGSLLLMKGKTQEYWQHQLPKTKKNKEARVNLTFRIIK